MCMKDISYPRVLTYNLIFTAQLQCLFQFWRAVQICPPHNSPDRFSTAVPPNQMSLVHLLRFHGLFGEKYCSALCRLLVSTNAGDYLIHLLPILQVSIPPRPVVLQPVSTCLRLQNFSESNLYMSLLHHSFFTTESGRQFKGHS